MPAVAGLRLLVAAGGGTAPLLPALVSRLTVTGIGTRILTRFMRWTAVGPSISGWDGQTNLTFDRPQEGHFLA